MSANQHSPSTPRSRTRVAQSKLRSSCDACGQAKIKCDRGQPACGRCIAQGMTCVYGVSRKAGKPPRKRPVVSASSLQVPSRLPSRLGGDSDAASMDLHGGALDGTDLGIMLSMGEDTSGIGASSPFSSSDAAFQSWFPFDAGYGGLGALPNGSSDWDSSMGGHGGGGSSSVLKPVESPAATSTTSATSASSTTAVAASTPRRSCTLETKDIMRRLYCTNPSAPAPDRLPARTLDLSSVLTRTSNIVVSLEALFKCPCARSPHMAMLYSSIVSRILLWYRQAASQATPERALPLSPSSPFKHTLAAHETLPPLSGSTAFKAFAAEDTEDNGFGVSVPPMPVMVGTFQSDDQNVQTALVSCLLLNDLKRVGGLIDLFISLGTSSSTRHAAGDVCPAADELSAGVADASLFASLGSWLRTEHGNIVRQARSGLSVLDENHGLQL